MKKILISALGASNYNESLCILPDGTKFKTHLVTHALLDYIKPDDIYIVGTPQSKWDLANELLGEGNYKKVVIPIGDREDNFWEMFRNINGSIDVDGKEIYIDITHSFRSIPLLISTVINLFTKVKGAKVRNLFYGLYKQTEGTTTIVDLLPIIELNEWIEGFTLFKNYGEGNFLADLIDIKLSELEDEERKKFGGLNKVSKLLRKYSEAVGFAALDFMPVFAKQVADSMKNVDEYPNALTAIELLKDSFESAYAELEKEHEEEWLNQYKLVKWLFNKRRYSQAIIALQECIITYILENLGLHHLHKVRKKVGGNLFEEDGGKEKFFTKELHGLFSRIRELRNYTGHAFMRAGVE